MTKHATDELKKTAEIAGKIKDNISRVLVGKETAVELALVSLGCEGHLLIEDVPGVGKTMFARALAISLGLSFNRIQCTPDLLPSDVTGFTVFNPKSGEFNFRCGSIMSHIVLVDEINRATPRTQASLLEAMEERQVTVDGTTHALERPFLVMATENPVEFEGTFPLPEAQLDRFLLRLSMGYPTHEEEITMLEKLSGEHPINQIGKVVEPGEIPILLAARRQIFVEDSLRGYITAVADKSREHPELELGVSPRGVLALFNAARMLAALRKRRFVIPEDIKYLAPYVLSHRVLVSAEAAVKGVRGEALVKEILESTPVPTEDAFHG
ncbi:MAG: AAA family ATPase [Bacillota bacterium]